MEKGDGMAMIPAFHHATEDAMAQNGTAKNGNIFFTDGKLLGRDLKPDFEKAIEYLLVKDRTTVNSRDIYFALATSENDVRQESGTIIYRINQDKGGFSVVTPHGLTGVLGTVFELSVASDSTTVGVQEGKVSLTNRQGESRTVQANEKLVMDASGKFSEKTVFDLKTDSYKYIKQNEKWVPAKE